MSEDEITPRLGRMRAKGRARARTYLGRISAAAARAGLGGATGGSRFDGSRIGRGASMGRLLSSRDRHAGARGRRAMVKVRLVKLGANGLSGATAHLRYLQRDGVTREGAPGQLYSASEDRTDGRALLERSSGDRHQFRFIVSAEDGDQYPDLKPLTRRLMAQVEQDLGTRLDWVAVDHFNTGHPHTHILVRGADERGANLVIAREYISHGLRERAAELVTLDLGPRTTQEIEARLRQDIGAERLTGIDRRLVRAMDTDHTVGAADRDPFQQSLRAGRLQKLGELGLAEDLGGGRWRLADGIEETLRRLGERGDIIRTLQRAMRDCQPSRDAGDQAVFNPADGGASPLVGRVISRGLADEHHDRHYLIVDGVDGVAHYVDIGRGGGEAGVRDGHVVRIVPAETVRDVDRTIERIARDHGGLYSADLHHATDVRASAAYVESHVRRLEAIRRATGGVERQTDGSWRIADDHLARVEAYAGRLSRDQPVTVEILSSRPLAELATADAATWLDRRLVGADDSPARDTGFGREVRAAQAQRREWLLDQGLAEGREGAVQYRADLLAALQRRELQRVAAQLSRELGLEFVETQTGDRVEGMLRRRVDVVSGRFALVENGHEFALVPWRPVLERRLGKPVGGIMREAGVSWQFGRERSGPGIS